MLGTLRRLFGTGLIQFQLQHFAGVAPTWCGHGVSGPCADNHAPVHHAAGVAGENPLPRGVQPLTENTNLPAVRVPGEHKIHIRAAKETHVLLRFVAQQP